MHIVVLDGYTLNPGDLSWDALRALGDSCTIYDRTPAALAVSRARDADIVLTNKTVLDAHVLAQLPKLRYIGVLATGYNVVDTAAAAARAIPVCNVPGYGTPSVAQMVFALLLELARRVGDHSTGVKNGRWNRQPDFCYWETPQRALEEMTLGIYGLGAVGTAVAKLGLAFGMSVLAYTRTPGQQEGVTYVDEKTLFRRSDALSLHCPLNEQTWHLINAERLSWMKPDAFLINTGRGPLINEGALAKALHEGRLGGAGLDVLESEPPEADNPLLSAPNCFITPHIAWATRNARGNLLDIAIANVRAFVAGSTQNRIN